MTFVAFTEVLRNVLLALAGGVGAWLAWKRLQPAADQASASSEQARLAQMGEERRSFREAAEDLSSDAMAVRLAAIYVLREIALEVPRFADPAFVVLLAHVRSELAALEDGADTSEDMKIALEVISRLQKPEAR